MGAQLSQNAITAVGSIPSNSTNQVNEHDIAKSILPLTKPELEEIITTEWNFTTSKIQDNFSNGSAFHYRSKLLPLVLETRLSSSSSDDDCSSSNDKISPSDRYIAMLSLARDEWESILLNAVFTEPDDQTPWWYHRFLISWAEPLAELENGDELVEEYVGLLFEMADSLRDLLEIEKESDMMCSSEKKKKDESKGVKCKWAYIGLHLCLDKLLPWIDEEEAGDLKEEATMCLTQLIKIDENRQERYLQL